MWSEDEGVPALPSIATNASTLWRTARIVRSLLLFSSSTMYSHKMVGKNSSSQVTKLDLLLLPRKSTI